MARPLRIARLAGWYHITARGNERRTIYRDDRDRRHFCELLGEMVSRFRVGRHAYVLMDNHHHWILELRELNLSRAVQWLNFWFNRLPVRAARRQGGTTAADTCFRAASSRWWSIRSAGDWRRADICFFLFFRT